MQLVNSQIWINQQPFVDFEKYLHDTRRINCTSSRRNYLTKAGNGKLARIWKEYVIEYVKCVTRQAEAL